MRDSPFPKFTLHLASYLRSERGRKIARAAAEATGLSTRQFLALLKPLPTLEILVPLGFDRVTWTGTPDIVLVGLASSLGEVVSSGTFTLTGYRTGGDPVAVPVAAQSDFPLMLIRPAKTNFGADPEEARRGAPSHARPTISTRKIERRMRMREDRRESTDTPDRQSASIGTQSAGLTGPGGGDGEDDDNGSEWDDDCTNDPNAIVECGGHGGGGDAGLVLSYDWSDCTQNVTSSEDRDSDGLLDVCEYEIAHAFRPEMVTSPHDGRLLARSGCGPGTVLRVDGEQRECPG